MGSHSQIENIDRPQFSYNSVTLKKKTIMQSTFVIFASILAMASATAINFEKPEERTFLGTTIDSNNFLALNSTVLTVAVLGLLVLVVAVLLLTGGFSPAKMAQLEQAFKKYQVTEAECEMYIACEASQVNRHE